MSDTDRQGEASSNVSGNSSTNQNEQNEQTETQSVFNYMNERKVDSALWMTRLCTIFFTLGYCLPLFGNPYSNYQKALISNAATSALRLHQRVPQLQMSRQFLAQLFMEDSCHYLLFSFIFIFTYPVTLALFPILLFAFLHSTNFTLIILGKAGWQSSGVATSLGNFVQLQQRNILKMIAMSEISLMPVCILMILSGKMSILTLFIYYRFLTMRYSSIRNPYTRNVFYELRCVTEIQIAKPGCPQFIRTLCQNAIGVIIRLAPPTVPQ